MSSRRRRKGIVKSTQQPQEEQFPAAADGDDAPLMDTFTRDRRTMTGSAGGPPRTARVDDLVGNPENAREDLGDDLEEFAASLKAHGVRQPLSVMAREDFLAVHPHHEEALGGASWVVINGNRRLVGAQMAGLDLVPIHMSGGTSDAVSMRVAVLVENIHRKDLAPLEEAREIAKLVGLGMSRSEVARLLEKTPGWVTQRLILLELHPDLQEALSNGELKLGRARELGKLSYEEQLAAYEQGAEEDAAFYTVKSSGAEPDAQSSQTPPSADPEGAQEQPAPTPSDGQEHGAGREAPRSDAFPGEEPPATGETSRPTTSPVPQAKAASSGPRQLQLDLTWGSGETKGLADQIYEGLAERLSSDELAAVVKDLAARL